MPKPTYHLDISSNIGWWGFTKHDAKRGLRDAPASDVHVRLSSLGGSLDDGLDIRRQFADHGDVTVHLVGMTASSATILAMGARRIVMSRGASMLIHNCSLFVSSWGMKNKEEVDEEIDRLKATHGTLETLDRVMAEIYAARTGKSIEEMAALMAENRWLNADEALALGLIDEIEDDLVAATPQNRESAFQAIAALGLPPIRAAAPEAPEAPATDDTPSLLRTIVAGVQELGRQVAAAFNPPTETTSSTTNNETLMNKETHSALLAALGLEELTATADGAATLTAEQLTTLNDRLAADAKATKEATDLAAATQTLLEAEKQTAAQLCTRIEALEKADGAEDGGKPAPEAKEEMSVQALAKLI